jgi:hypothetical protein
MQRSCFGQDLIADDPVERRLRHEINRSAEQRCQLVFELVDREPEVSPGSQHVQQVEIAVGPGVTSCNRSEGRGAFQAAPDGLESRLVPELEAPGGCRHVAGDRVVFSRSNRPQQLVTSERARVTANGECGDSASGVPAAGLCSIYKRIRAWRPRRHWMVVQSGTDPLARRGRSRVRVAV